MATEALALPRLVGRWFLNATSHVGRVALLRGRTWCGA